ncbi:RluA family pseudouridine synthase [Flavobacteriales bacterium]|nr:RluA family pseudouridine synthase [Flavobacteriales bacterium]
MSKNRLEGQDPEAEFNEVTFVADENQSALRIDKFIIDRIPNTTRSKIQGGIKDGYVKVNGEVVKANYKVRPGDEVRLQLPPKKTIEITAEDIPLDIVYEDKTLLILNKKAGMVVHPGHGNYEGTMVNALMYHFDNLPQRDDHNDRPGIVHRLDKLTTGIMVVAKTDEALANLSKQFFDRTSDRRYWALVWGDVETDEGRIEGHIGRSLKNRKVMQVFPDGEYGKSAVTNFKVVKRFGYVTLVECKLESGRTHQIRAHFKYIGHPVFNDLEYGGNRILKGTTFTKYKQFVQNTFKELPGQALHAKTLTVDHPETGERLAFDSDVPQGFQNVLDRWDNYLSSRKD